MKVQNYFSAIAGILFSVCLLLPATNGLAASNITEQKAHDIGVEAYIYLYPLVTMDITRRQLTNVAPGEEFGRGPMNMFVSAREFPPATFREVVRPNFDTLYSSAWLDMMHGPMVVSAPNTHGRYYLLPMLDMWTDVFASPGWRTTGTQAHNFLVTPPGWTGAIPNGMTRIKAPTPYVWIIGRTQTNGPKDYDAVHKIQDGFRVTPLSEWGKPAGPVAVEVDPSVDMKTPPKEQVNGMSAARFFTYAAELLKVNPPHITDQPIVARMKRIGIVAGKSLDFAKLDPEVRNALATVPADAQKEMAWKIPTLARVANGWSMNTDTVGVYGNYYLKRAIVTEVGLGANVPEDAIYPLNLVDSAGKPLDGASDYTIHFAKDATPPVEAFWSITLYDANGFPVPNDINRQALSSWMPLHYNADGSLDLYVQHARPGKDHESNWLPAPEGPFNLLMRLYAPKAHALDGHWNPPPVVKAGR